MTTVSREVARLLERGFRALPNPSPKRRYAGTYLYRFTNDGHVDTVVIRVDEYAIAARVHNKFNPSRPLDVGPADWIHDGDIGEVVSTLLGRTPSRLGRTFACVLDVTQPG